MICVIDGCSKPTPPHGRCLCRDHWRLLPAAMVSDIERAYSHSRSLGEQAPGFFRAHAAAIQWIRVTLGGTEDKPRASWDSVVRQVRARDAARGHVAPVGASTKPDAEPQPPARGQLDLL